MPTRIVDPPSSGDATAASRESTSPSPPASEPGAGSKRRRSGTTSDRPSNRRRNRSPSASAGYDTDEDVYDPDQPLEERRSVQQGYRDLLRDITENGDVYLDKDSVGLHETILKANTLSKQLRQTTEAAIDSRLLVSTTDLSYRKTLRLARGSLLQGLDCDDFVSHCIAYMRRGGGIADDDAPELSSTQRLRRRRSAPHRRPSSGAVQNDEYEDDEDEDDDDDDSGDMMNWPHLGRFACLPHSRRPGLAGFLLGPLSLEKKARRVTKRSAPFRPNALTETRPEVLDVADMAKKENDLTAICAKILQQLYAIQADIQGTVADLIHDDMDDDEKTRIMHQHGLRSTGGIDLLRFVINPKSFAQTVENIFYVSFLVRDSRVEIDFDELDIPALAPVDREPDEEQDTSRHGAAKHQAVLSMNMNLWREAVDFFRLTEPMIEHRPETALPGPGARGWYS